MHYVRQLGNGRNCARKGCEDRPHFRVILGRFRVQVYICSGHVLWGVELDSLRQETGESLGWEYGYRQSPNLVVVQTPRIVTLAVKDYDYTRDESKNISAGWPTKDGRWS